MMADVSELKVVLGLSFPWWAKLVFRILLLLGLEVPAANFVMSRIRVNPDTKVRSGE